MEKKQKRTKVVVSVLVLAGLVVFALTAIGGNLEPSAPPGPTMKTLDEVEPRIPIPASDTPAGTFTISESGSYYLTGERNASGTGITVEANDVTIDLMGYQLIGSGGGSGIYMNGRSNVEIRNGTVRGFSSDGINEFSNNGKAHRVINVRVVSNGSCGIYLKGSGHLVKDCTAVGNVGYEGIRVSEGCTITGNTCRDNGRDGILTGYSCTVTGNTCSDNNGDGIQVGNGSTVTGNTCYSNGVNGINGSNGCTMTGNTCNYNGSSGLIAFGRCTVIRNTVMENNQDNNSLSGGIKVMEDCLVNGNNVIANMQKNIYVSNDDNVVEENLVTDSANGIYFNTSGNFYDNNRASGCTTNYNDPGGNTNGGGNVSF